MSAYVIFIATIVVIFAMILMGYRSVGVFRRAVETSPYFKRKIQLKNEIETLEKALEQVHRSISESKLKLNNLSADIKKGEMTIARAGADKKWLDEHEKELSGKKAIIAKLEQEIKELTDKYNGKDEKFRQQLQDLQAQIQPLSDEARDLRRILDELKIALDNAKNAKRVAEAEQNVAVKLAAEAVAKKVMAEQDLLNTKKEFDVLVEKNKILTSDNQNLTAETKKLEAQKETLLWQIKVTEKARDNAIKERVEAEGEKTKLDNEIKNLQIEIEKLKAERGFLGPTHDPGHCWKKLDESLPNVIFKGKTPDKEQDWLDEFTENLGNAGIAFPNRTLQAFHTSMKVQAFAPIAVLAGISGTGKSLLPELYARAIGMNFLQVAVQPRWDSPQDMLGFYNYMEREFKATELSRLLWGADRFNNTEKYHRSMNMVLLDEMNLARVEYYFSDMLSKLEVRRGLDPRKDSERRAAEIELECGTGAAPRRLFIGGNTLFVGTMNEDESTQSLSDKVLDRANVIRFGKPTQLNVKPNKQAFMDAYDDRMMTLDTWCNWYTDRDSQVAAALEEPLQRINAELMRLRRPFGHRVWQSIEAYVKNYPGGTDVRSDAFRHAFADQIEMKILPKLNGIDKQDYTASNVLAALKGIILQATDDQELSTAWETVMGDSNNSFFQWRGVSR